MARDGRFFHMSGRPRKRSGGAPAVDRPRLRKSLGQHHLRSGAICRPLIEYLAPAGRLVVEVGPGGGVLTGELLQAGGRVLALELDADWAETLRRRIDSPDLEIRIADSGRGISRDFLPHVFDMFRQGDPSTTRDVSGIGLGLNLVKRFVELQRGTVEVHSDGEGSGASFTCRFPLHRPESEAKAG